MASSGGSLLYCFAKASQEARKRFGRGQVSTHSMTNMALGCTDRSRLSLEHLLSSGVYNLLQKPTQKAWTLATSCPLPPTWMPLRAVFNWMTRKANGLGCIQVLVSCQRCHSVSVMCQSPLTWALFYLPSTVSLALKGLAAWQPVSIFWYAKAFSIRHLPYSRPILLIKMDGPGSAVAASCNRGPQMDASHFMSRPALQ